MFSGWDAGWAMTSTKELADNTILTIVARFAMIAATTVALPVVGWILVRGVNAIDDVSHKADVIHDQVQTTDSNIKLIQQAQDGQARILADHEARVRLLEGRMMQRPPQ